MTKRNLFAFAMGLLALLPAGCGSIPDQPMVHNGSADMPVPVNSECEQINGAGQIGYTYISGTTFTRRRVSYHIRNGRAIVEGDIDLGTVDEMEKARLAVEHKEGRLGIFGVVISGNNYRWPAKKIYYTIDPALPNKERVANAIEHWQEKTEIRFVQRTTEANYVTFKPGTGCSSNVGMRGKKQFVQLGDDCSTGNVIHEIGHVVGLWHEQSREDRDKHVQIIWANIQDDKKNNFDQHISDGDDIGAYDFGSIMHYPSNAFAKDAGKATIITIPPGQAIGQRVSLSAGDISTVKIIYP